MKERYTQIILDDYSVTMSFGDNILPNGGIPDPQVALWDFMEALVATYAPESSYIAIEGKYKDKACLDVRVVGYDDCGGWTTLLSRDLAPRFVVSKMIETLKNSEYENVLVVTSDTRLFELLSSRVDVGIVDCEGRLSIWNEVRFVVENGYFPQFHPLYVTMVGSEYCPFDPLTSSGVARRILASEPDAFLLASDRDNEDHFWRSVADRWWEYEFLISSKHDGVDIEVVECDSSMIEMVRSLSDKQFKGIGL